MTSTLKWIFRTPYWITFDVKLKSWTKVRERERERDRVMNKKRKTRGILPFHLLHERITYLFSLHNIVSKDGIKWRRELERTSKPASNYFEVFSKKEKNKRKKKQQKTSMAKSTNWLYLLSCTRNCVEIEVMQWGFWCFNFSHAELLIKKNTVGHLCLLINHIQTYGV